MSAHLKPVRVPLDEVFIEILSGEATVRIGGEDGPTYAVRKGDTLTIPTSVEVRGA